MADDRDPMDPESWYREPGVCGSCIAWKPGDPRPGEEVAAGSCRLRPELSRVPATLRKCDLYKGRGQFVYQPGSTPSPGRRKRAAPPRVLKRTDDGKLVETKAPPAPRAPREPDAPRTPVERPVAPREVDVGTDSLDTLRSVFVQLLRHDFRDAGREMLGRFEGGRVETRVGDRVTKSIEVERFFGMLERFRVTLDELEDAIVRQDALLPMVPELIGQLRRIQGSFTTFNLLYGDRSDYFSGKE